MHEMIFEIPTEIFIIIFITIYYLRLTTYKSNHHQYRIHHFPIYKNSDIFSNMY